MVKALDGGFVCWETILGPDLAKAFSEGGMHPRILYMGKERGGNRNSLRFAERRRRRGGEGISRKNLFCVDRILLSCSPFID